MFRTRIPSLSTSIALILAVPLSSVSDGQTPAVPTAASAQQAATQAQATADKTQSQVDALTKSLTSQGKQSDFQLSLGIGSLVLNPNVSDYTNQANTLQSTSLGSATPQYLVGVSLRTYIPNFTRFRHNSVFGDTDSPLDKKRVLGWSDCNPKPATPAPVIKQPPTDGSVSKDKGTLAPANAPVSPTAGATQPAVTDQKSATTDAKPPTPADNAATEAADLESAAKDLQSAAAALKSATSAKPTGAATQDTVQIAYQPAECQVWRQRPWGGFVSLKFSPASSQTLNGYVIGGSYSIGTYLDILIGFALTPVNEASPGLRVAASQYVTAQQALGNDLNFNPVAMLNGDKNAFDGFPLTNPVGTLIYKGTALETHYRGGAVFGISLPISFASVFSPGQK
jgi:hypothetical protein